MQLLLRAAVRPPLASVIVKGNGLRFSSPSSCVTCGVIIASVEHPLFEMDDEPSCFLILWCCSIDATRRWSWHASACVCSPVALYAVSLFVLLVEPTAAAAATRARKTAAAASFWMRWLLSLYCGCVSGYGDCLAASFVGRGVLLAGLDRA